MHNRMLLAIVSVMAVWASTSVYAQSESSMAPTAIIGAGVAPQVQPVEGETLHLESYPHYAGSEANVVLNKTMVLRSEEEWQGAWLQTGVKAPGPFPGKSIAVAVFLGKRPNQNFSVRINDVIVNGNDMIVKFFENKPLNPQIATGMPSSPWVIQVLPAVEGRVRFVPANGVR